MEQKIGIVTIYDLNNYGNRLQNYATLNYLNKNGYYAETLIVEYVTLFQVFKNFLKKLLGKDIYKEWNLTQESKERISSLSELDKKRYKKFYDFTYRYAPPRYIKYIGRICLSPNHSFDKIFVGSDQVWNPTIAQATNTEFLRFVASKKRVAWAASFGVDNIELHKKRIIKGIKEIPYLSVREESAKNIIKKMCERDAEILIDPTLLLDAKDWKGISQKPENIECDRDYILTYFLGGRPNRANILLREYKNKGYKIYNLADKTDETLYSLGPEEFLYLLEHAKLVLTDSFHACAFSFIFDRPFIVFQRAGRNSGMMSRITTFLNMFDLTRKYIDSGINNDVFEHDYTVGKKILEKEREKVHDFLELVMNS